jgi:hypothetical protein
LAAAGVPVIEVAAAMTAQQQTHGLTQEIGEIVVPAGRW